MSIQRKENARVPNEPNENVFALLQAAGGAPDAFLSRVLDCSDAGIFACDAEGHFVFANRGWQNAVGKTQAEIGGKSFQAVYEGAALETFSGLIRQVLEKGEAASAEFVFGENGGRAWFQVSLFPFATRQAKLSCLADWQWT